MMKYRTGIGQDSHRFLPEETAKLCIIGGVEFEGVPGFNANSDGDIVYHAICNAITSLTGILILGGLADELCEKKGITDSAEYLKEAKKTLGKQEITHVAITVEAKRPHMKDSIEQIRANVASLLEINIDQVGLTATSGEGLTDFGCGAGAQAFAVITTVEST